MSDKINIIANLLNIFAFETISIEAVAVGFTAATIVNSNDAYAKKALVTVESAQLRWRCDSNPTSTVGHLLQPGDVLILIGSENIRNFKAIRTGSTNAKISVSYSL